MKKIGSVLTQMQEIRANNDARRDHRATGCDHLDRHSSYSNVFLSWSQAGQHADGKISNAPSN